MSLSCPSFFVQLGRSECNSPVVSSCFEPLFTAAGLRQRSRTSPALVFQRHALSRGAESNTKPARKKQGAQVAPSISRQRLTHFTPSQGGVCIGAGNTPGSCLPVKTLDTRRTLALLQEMLLALRVNDAEDFKGWVAFGLEELGRQVVIELMQVLMNRTDLSYWCRESIRWAY